MVCRQTTLLIFFVSGSRQVEAVQVHHLGPRGDEVLEELFLRIAAAIDFRQGAQFGVRAEDQIDPAAGPLDFAGDAVTIEVLDDERMGTFTR